MALFFAEIKKACLSEHTNGLEETNDCPQPNSIFLENAMEKKFLG
jgi:hypothetical protein